MYSFQIAFSSLFEEKCPFTRDYNQVKVVLQNLEDYDKTSIETALHAASQLILSEWGSNAPCQVQLLFLKELGVLTKHI